MSVERATAGDAMETAYGFREVGQGEKQGLVDGVFHRVADRYDLMNDLMSAGLHRAWKNATVAALNPPPRASYRALDVAGGTGDVAFRILDAARDKPHVTVLDINGSMLDVGRARAASRNAPDRLDFVEANAEALPFADETFDAYTIAFGIRNVPRIDTALSEAFRTLRHGGRFLCLEFSQVDVPGLDKLYDAWSFAAIPRIGKLVTGDGEPYRYLVESIRKFPNQASFAAMIEDAGFSRVTWQDFSGGIAALHSGWKL